MNRSLKLSILAALALGSSQVMALNLGQVQVKSALGQPLLAEVPVQPANPAELQNLSVKLASSAEFARAGIVDGGSTVPLHFSVVNGTHGKIIRITSSQVVDNPYLDLLLEMHSKAGKSVREVAILLDPATSTPSAAPAVAAAAPAPVQAKPAASSAMHHAPAAEHAANAPSMNNGHYGPVKSGETLSAIARSTAPSGVDVEQMLLALKQANPNAFYRDNINALKSGSVLRVPTAAEAQAMTIAAAVAEVRRQNSDWRAGTPGKTALVADAATRTSSSSAPGSTSQGTGDRLALVPAKTANGAPTQGGNAAGKDDKSVASLRQDLLRSQESLASLQEQSSDLKTRLKDLSDINHKNAHLLSLKNSEIAELQAKLAAARKTAGLPAAATSAPVSKIAAAPTAQSEIAAASSTAAAGASMKPATATSAPVAMNTPATASTATTPANAGSSASAALAAAVAPTTAKPVVKPAERPAEKSAVTRSPAPPVEQPWYMQTWAWAIGAGAVVLLILLALFGRRRKPSAAAPANSSKSSASLADRFASSAAPAMPTGNITGDDVDQEDLLDQLAEHPDDIYLHLELVTLYYSRRDVEHFEAAAEAMHAHITDPQQDEWQDVLHMGEDLAPGHPLFDHHPELPPDEAAAARSEFNIDDYAGKDDTAKAAPIAATAAPAPPPLPASEPKKVSEYNFNFDLTKPVVAAADQPPVANTSVPPASETHGADAGAAAMDSTTSDWHFDETNNGLMGDAHATEELTDDPVDTKLDLARAYLDMGDPDGARAMLDEVMKEGSKMQQDTAKQLLGTLH